MCQTVSKFLGGLSPNNSRHSEIMVMGWEHLDAQLETKEINESIREIIHGMAGGQAAHQADALKFGLYSVLQQKGTPIRAFARLRCTYRACEAHRQPISLFSQGNGIKCTKRTGLFDTVCNQTMECSECGHAHTDHCNWCKGCRSVFG